MSEKLYVITVISNPRRFRSRYSLYRDFAKRMAAAGVELYTVELAFGSRPFEITESDNPKHIQVRSAHELWHKENMINIALGRLPSDWKYVAWIDADIQFVRPDWAEETVQMLQHHDVVQMFSVAQDLSPSHEPFNRRIGFVKQWLETGEYLGQRGEKYCGNPNSHPGYCWAATRSAMDQLGGMFDMGILGSGDHHFATALIGKAIFSVPHGVSDGYKNAILIYEKRAAALKHNIGYVDGLVNHFFHGAKSKRGYNWRSKILIEHAFDPLKDIVKDTQGLWQLTDEKPGLRDDIRRYFISRDEDSTAMD